MSYMRPSYTPLPLDAPHPFKLYRYRERGHPQTSARCSLAVLFVPGHGPVTDRGGVEASIDYWEYVAKGAEACFSAGADADDCGLEMLADLPTPWKDWTDPERILVNVKVQYGHLAAPGEFKVNSTLKFDLIGEQGKYLVKKQLGYL